MPSRKQRRRTLKERRHEYETVWVDGDGNELDEPPDELAATPEKRNGTKSSVKPKATQQRGGRQVRVPPPPSWQRAGKRAAIIGVVIFVFIFMTRRSAAPALMLALIYTALFVPFQFMLDRFAYNRWQRRNEAQPAGRAAKKR
jgi:hypothetical protein